MRSALEDPAVSGPIADAERAAAELAADIRAAGRFTFVLISFAVGAALSALIIL
ncbi:hypothetical protein ACJ41P_10325 [Azospirillum argentinense]|uniref:Uncharacterized protein n=1 Tax=Azospirillum argentinense TaxID=2970906 RepID=A0ABW8V819_9PROT